MRISPVFRRTLFGLTTAVALSSALVLPTLADDSVTQEITGGGDLSAFVTDATMASISYHNAADSTTGTLTLTVSDPRGTSEGWNVTIQSSDFNYGGASTLGIDIPAEGFVITSVGTPSKTAGQSVHGIGGPNVGVGGSLEQARKVISANVGFGSGVYSQSLPVSLVIPAYSQIGTYVADLTVMITSAP